MTEQPTQIQPPQRHEPKAGCVGLLAGLVLLALVSFLLTGVGYLVAHLLHWV